MKDILEFFSNNFLFYLFSFLGLLYLSQVLLWGWKEGFYSLFDSGDGEEEIYYEERFAEFTYPQKVAYLFFVLLTVYFMMLTGISILSFILLYFVI